MKKKKFFVRRAVRIFTALSAMLTVLIAGCLSAAADDSFTEGDFQFTVTSDASCSVEVYNGSDTYVSVPGNAGGYLVTAIADCAFYQNGTLQTVVLPDGIETIGEYAFYECTALSQITLPEGLRTIGIGAFVECESLTSVTLPGSVQLLQKGAFAACGNLHAVYYQGTMPECEDQVFAKCADDFQMISNVQTTEASADSLYGQVLSIDYNGHRYYLIEESISWQQAELWCEEHGGQLATVDSSDEEQILLDLVKQGTKYHYWLGGTDEQQEGVWKWVTGEKWYYSAWTIDAPNNCDWGDGRGEDYLALSYVPFAGLEGWDDLTETCTTGNTEVWGLNRMGFILEVDL